MSDAETYARSAFLGQTITIFNQEYVVRKVGSSKWALVCNPTNPTESSMLFSTHRRKGATSVRADTEGLHSEMSSLFNLHFRCPCCNFMSKSACDALKHSHIENHKLWFVEQLPTPVLFLQVYKCLMPGCTACISFPGHKRKTSVKITRSLADHLFNSHVCTKSMLICSKPDCFYTVTTQTALDSHMASAHSSQRSKRPKRNNSDNTDIADFQTNDSSIRCDQCDKTFDSNFYLRIHMRFHKMDRPFQCQTCFKSFHTRSNHNRHQLKHCPRLSIRRSSQKCPKTAKVSRASNNPVDHPNFAPSLLSNPIDISKSRETGENEDDLFELFDLDWLNIESKDLVVSRRRSVMPNVITISRDMESMMSHNSNYFNGSARTDYICNYMAKHRASLRRLRRKNVECRKRSRHISNCGDISFSSEERMMGLEAPSPLIEDSNSFIDDIIRLRTRTNEGSLSVGTPATPTTASCSEDDYVSINMDDDFWSPDAHNEETDGLL